MEQPVRKIAFNEDKPLPDSSPAELFSRFGSAVYAYALRVLTKPAEAEEIVSETFLRICKTKEKYRGQGSIKGWVFSIAHRLCLDMIRVKARQGKRVSFPEQLPAEEISSPPLVLEHEQERIIRAAVEKLSAEQREVIMLKIYGGLTFSQISQTLHIPLGTALARMHQGLKRLRLDPDLEKLRR